MYLSFDYDSAKELLNMHVSDDRPTHQMVDQKGHLKCERFDGQERG